MGGGRRLKVNILDYFFLADSWPVLRLENLLDVFVSVANLYFSCQLQNSFSL